VSLKQPVGRACFYVKPSMTKWEVKEYLTKIYDVDVTKVTTANFLGKFMFVMSALFIFVAGRWKRFYGKRKVVAYKRRNMKKAYVEFVNSEIEA
jgi:large subunit ribosomal protein L23